MKTYRVAKNGIWIANIIASRIECEKASIEIGAPPIHFFREAGLPGEGLYVAGFYPDVVVTVDGTQVYPASQTVVDVTYNPEMATELP